MCLPFSSSPLAAASWGRVRYRIPYFGDSGYVENTRKEASLILCLPMRWLNDDDWRSLTDRRRALTIRSGWFSVYWKVTERRKSFGWSIRKSKRKSLQDWFINLVSTACFIQLADDPGMYFCDDDVLNTLYPYIKVICPDLVILDNRQVIFCKRNCTSWDHNIFFETFIVIARNTLAAEKPNRINVW